jgi:8-oxo-dGTP diphosphatase
MEETGYVGELGDLLIVDSWARRLRERDGSEKDYHGVRIVYRCRVVGGQLQIEADGSTDDARWFTPDDLRSMPVVDLVRVALDRIRVA